MSERLRAVVSGVRFRTTVVATLVVGTVLAVALVVLAAQTRSRIESSITDAAETRAADLAALASGGFDGPLPGRGTDLLAQVVAADGRVLAASPALEGLDPILPLRLQPGEMQQLEVDGILEEVEELIEEIEDEGPYRVVARGALGDEGPVTVFVASSLEPASAALGALSPLLVVAYPFVVLLVAATVWAFTGRALRPVEAMREEAEAISATDLHRRLTDPPSRDEIHRLARTLNAMLDRIETSADQQRRFVADASHELKSPVAAIRAMLDVAAADPGFSEWRTLLDDLRFEDARLEALVEDMLLLARADGGAPPGRRVEVDLDQVAGREAAALRARGATRVDASALAPVRVIGDPGRLEQLVRNLLENAARHAGSQVWVSTRREGNDAVLRVSDDGSGIAAADRERVFERFVRLDEARDRHAGGTGLGLAVSRAIARRHGGDLQVVDPLRGGASFELRLPVAG